MNKKVLIITYYWPPSGGSGVQRWLKFVKYLPQNGITPVVYTPENPDFSLLDESLMNDIPKEAVVIKRKITEPYGFYRMLVGKKESNNTNFGFVNDTKPSFTKRVSIWIRGNFFIPDPRIWWVAPSVKYLKKYIIENGIDTIITTGPPHSMHLIGLKLKKSFGNKIKWISDFRDPWTEIVHYKDLKLSSWADKKHHHQEKEVLSKSDLVITISNSIKQDFLKIGAKNVEVITNGYDISDIETSNTEFSLDKKFSIAHIGLLSGSRNPSMLWKVLSEIAKEIPEFKTDLEIKLVGTVDQSTKDDIDQFGLSENTNYIPSVSHKKAIEFQKKSQLLLLLINNVPNAKGILTGKFFEYIAAQRPIIAIGPEDGDVADILTETQCGEIAGFENKTKLKKTIAQYYLKYKEGNLSVDSRGYQKFSRENLTKELASILHKI